MTKLHIEHLRKDYGANRAVDDLSLNVEKGQFVSLLGPSGCGKTTTLRMIAGFMSPTSGTIEMDGRILSSAREAVPPERRGMSMIFQSYAIWPHMTVAENVGFGLKIKGMRGADLERKIADVLAVVQLQQLAGRYPGELSGGQQQRVALARAVVIEPEVLLLDEPLSNLDAGLREEMRFEIRRLHERFGMTTIYVTHDQSEAMAISDTIVVMNLGKVEQIGDPYVVYNRPATRFVAGFIGKTNLLAGRRAGEAIHIPGFETSCGGAGGSGVEVLFSVRPENVHLSREAPPKVGRWVGRGKLGRRSYLGDQWDYSVRLADMDIELRVVAHPNIVFESGEALWIVIDPEQVAEIAR